MVRVVAGLVLFAACSTSGPTRQSTSTTSSTVSVTTISSAGAAGTVTSSRTTKTTARRPAPTTGTTIAPGISPAPIDAQMGSSCAQPGGTQSITVSSTPGFSVAYVTTWPDGSTHTQPPDQYPPGTGYGSASIPPSGTFTQTWTLPATAPLGDHASTEISVAGTDPKKPTYAHQILDWRVALAC